MVGRLKGKNAVVTGAGRGIGRRLAEMFAQEGARVLAVDINPTALETLKSPEIAIYATDLTDPAGMPDLAAEAGRVSGGKIDILANAAAVTTFAPIDEMSYEDWSLTMRGEVDTVFLVTQALWPLLKASGAGSIINFGSASAHVSVEGLPAIAHNAGKGAVTSMTRQLAMEGRLHNIRANTIAPGFIMTEETARHADNEEFMTSVRKKLMLDRLGTTDDIGHLAIYLASDESGYVTASDLRIDGGATAW